MQNYYDVKAIQAALTKEDVIRIVADLGSHNYRVGGSGELIFQDLIETLWNVKSITI